MTRIIAVAVPKGGTGKTTTTLNLGAALAEHGQRVLLVDFDPQGNLSHTMGQEANLLHSVYSAIADYLDTYEPHLDEVIVTTGAGVDLAPADVRLNKANSSLTTALNGQQVLKRLLEPIEERYDIILIDTLPYLGILVTNVLVAARELIIPLEAEYLATQSAALMLEQVTQIRKARLNADLRVTGILLTKVDPRTSIGRQIVDFTRSEFGLHVPVFATIIKRSVRFTESQASQQTILQYEPHGEGARAYRALAEEVLRAAP